MDKRIASRSKFTEARIIFAIKQSETIVSVEEVCRKGDKATGPVTKNPTIN